MKNQMFCTTTQSFQTIKNAFGQFAFATLLTLFMFNGLMSAESAPKQFVSFQNFIENAKTASSGTYVGHAGKRVKDAASFEEMRQHALQMYNEVHVSHSFLLDSHYFDCVPVEEQPSFRMLGQKQIATPPPTPPPHQQLGEDAPVAASQIGPDNQFDQFGNSTHCEGNTIPMRRLTLEDMSQFENLKQFLAKGRDGASRFTRPNDPQPNGDGYVHHYAYAQQNVKNLGGNSDLNLWSPYVNTGVGGETMSLSQEWYVGGSPTQTAEVGWQNQPNTWGSENSVLFIYWTADDYNNTGCYNLDCGAFTQTNNNWYFGSGFNNYSSIGGSQYLLLSRVFPERWKLVARTGWAVGWLLSRLYLRRRPDVAQRADHPVRRRSGCSDPMAPHGQRRLERQGLEIRGLPERHLVLRHRLGKVVGWSHTGATVKALLHGLFPDLRSHLVLLRRAGRKRLLMVEPGISVAK